MLRNLLLLACAVLLLAGLWFLLKPAPIQVSPSAAERAVYQFQLQAGVLTGPKRMVVQQGDAVQLQLLSDVEDALHLHGYDLSAELRPGVPVTLEFTAVQTGRFELELHQTHAELGVLEVYPRP